MFLVSIMTRRDKLVSLRDGLNAIGVLGMTVTVIEGCGTQLGYDKTYDGPRDTIRLRPEVLVETVVSTVPVDAVIDVAVRTLRTGEIGDGKISVSRVDKVVRVRTGETDLAALTNPAYENLEKN